MAVKRYLTVVDEVPEKATVFRFPKMPAFKGDEDQNLACGKCGVVVGRNITTETLMERFSTQGQLVVICECGSYNLVPTTRVA